MALMDLPDLSETVRCEGCGWCGALREAVQPVDDLARCPRCGAPGLRLTPAGVQATLDAVLPLAEAFRAIGHMIAEAFTRWKAEHPDQYRALLQAMQERRGADPKGSGLPNEPAAS